MQRQVNKECFPMPRGSQGQMLFKSEIELRQDQRDFEKTVEVKRINELIQAGNEDIDGQQPIVEIKNGIRRTVTYIKIKGQVYKRTEARKPNRYAPTEMIESSPWFQSNRDIRPALAHVEQGLANDNPPRFENLDRMLSEDCVQIAGRVFAFHKATKSDTEPKFWLRPEWLRNHLKLDWESAVRLAEAWRSIELGRKEAMQLMFGIKDRKTGEVYEEGLKSLADDGEDMESIVGYYEVLADQLPELEGQYINGNPALRMLTEGELSIGFVEEPDSQEEPDEWDGLAGQIKSTPIDRLHPMCLESDSCKHEFLETIRTATRGTIKLVMAGMFPQKDEATGWWSPARYARLTPSQKSQAWEAINSRRRKLLMI